MGSTGGAGNGVITAPRLAFDVTFLLRRHFMRPTGIDRVQLEIVSELVEADEQTAQFVQFVQFDEQQGLFEVVSPSTVRARAVAMRGSADASPAGDAKHGPTTGRSSAGAVARVVRAFRRLSPSPSVTRHARLAAGHARRSAQELVRAAREVLAAVSKRRRPSTAACASAQWTEATTLVSLGMDFARYAPYLAERRTERGFRVCLVVYDLIPIVRPQYATIEFETFILKILDLSDEILVISEATRRDLEAFAAQHERSLPSVRLLPLGSALRDLVPSCPPALAGHADVSSSEGFVLFVSTLTLRKNHHLLFDVWETLLQGQGRAGTPRLVIAGQRGSLSTEVQSRLDRTPEFVDVVFHVEEATDAEIAWLYANCTFTVYPSLYEGWGLPVSESHDFAKVCLASDRASLPEAAEGLAELLDPFDRSIWKERIMHYWTSEPARHALEAEIASRHVRVSARQTTDTILDLSGVR